MFFRFPTIAALADHLSAESDTAGAATTAQERTASRREGVRQQRLIRLAQRHSIQQPAGDES
jgi:hypothetical protein